MHRQDSSGFISFAIGTLSPRRITLPDIETLMQELAMESLARLSLPLANRWKSPKVNVIGLFRTFGEALELYRKALSTAYVTAVFTSSETAKECFPEDLEGRDPRW